MRNIDEILDSEISENLQEYFIVNPLCREWVKDAMYVFAEEYHRTELLKLNKSSVICSLDFKELERKFDEALARETSESLNAWLNEKRQ